MSEKILFENLLTQVPVSETPLTEAEPNHGSSTQDTGYNIDGNTDGKKLGFARSVVSKTLPALLSYIQPIEYPSGYIFGLRARGGVDSPIVMNPDNIEYQGTALQTTVSVDDPYGANTSGIMEHGIGHNTRQEITVARKSINTGIREVVINTTNEVEQDIKALFGSDYTKAYEEIEIAGSGEKKSVAKFFNEFAFSEMVKKTNAEFTNFLETYARNLGTATLSGDESEKLLGIIGELQAGLMKGRKKFGGRVWMIATPIIAGILSGLKGAYDNTQSEFSVVKKPNSYDNTYVTTLGNIDVYVSPYFSTVSAGEEKIIMGIVGGPNSSSIYYTPYKEYVVVGGSDINTGHNNFFYRVRDDWQTNPLDTYGDTQPIPPSTEVQPVPNQSDFLVSATITYNKLLS